MKTAINIGDRFGHLTIINKDTRPQLALPLRLWTRTICHHQRLAARNKKLWLQSFQR